MSSSSFIFVLSLYVCVSANHFISHPLTGLVSQFSCKTVFKCYFNAADVYFSKAQKFVQKQEDANFLSKFNVSIKSMCKSVLTTHAAFTDLKTKYTAIWYPEMCGHVLYFAISHSRKSSISNGLFFLSFFTHHANHHDHTLFMDGKTGQVS